MLDERWSSLLGCSAATLPASPLRQAAAATVLVDKPLAKVTRNRSGLDFRLVTRVGFALQSEGQRASRSFGNHYLAAVDPSGTHTVKVSLGNCKSSDPEKPAIDLT